MSNTGYLKLWAYASTARYPLEDVAVVVTDADGTAIAMALTDRNGRIAPIAIAVPDKEESQYPNPPEIPYTIVNLYAHARGYEQVYAEGIQIFPDTTTDQELEMVPLSEHPQYFDLNTLYITPPQNL